MQITNSFINKHCERIKCAAYAAAPIKVERRQRSREEVKGAIGGDCLLVVLVNAPWPCLHVEIKM